MINIDKGYVSQWDDFEFLPDVVESLHRLWRSGCILIVVTNQSGIGRGLYSEETYCELTQRMLDYLGARDVPIASVYHCPHVPPEKLAPGEKPCSCRKPAPGLLLRAQREYGLHMAESVLIGDKLTDIEAGRNANVGAAYLLAPKGVHSDGAKIANGCFENLADCVDHILGGQQSK